MVAIPRAGCSGTYWSFCPLKKNYLKEPQMNLAGQAPEKPHLILKDLFIDIGKTEQIMFRSPTFCSRTLQIPLANFFSAVNFK